MFTFRHDHEKKVHSPITHRLKGLPAKNDWKVEGPHMEGGTAEVKTGGEGNLLLGLEDFPLLYRIPDSLLVVLLLQRTGFLKAIRRSTDVHDNLTLQIRSSANSQVVVGHSIENRLKSQ